MKQILLLIFLTFITCRVFAQIPEGYYDPVNVQLGEDLQAVLHDIIDDHKVLSYSTLWSAYEETDRRADGTVWDMYTEIDWTYGNDQCGNTGGGEGSCYNREHSFPKSWFDQGSPMQTDLFHIYPTDGYVNSMRSNLPYGETDSHTFESSSGCKKGPCSVDGYSGTIFEPADEYKGDLARTYFYMATRYFGEDNGWTGSPMVNGAQPKPWALEMLLKWHREDPVSQKEIDRNNAAYNWQENRNPFVDHPEYVGIIWDGDAHEDQTEPTKHVANLSASFIDLSWTDATGEVTPNGYLICYSNTSFGDVTIPQDGVETSNYNNAIAVAFGEEHCRISGLEQGDTYFIKIFSFSKNSHDIDYKTEGDIPQLEIIAQ